MRIINKRRNTRIYLHKVNKVYSKLVNKMLYKFDFVAVNDNLGRLSFSLYAKDRHLRNIKAKAKLAAANFTLNSSYFDWKA